MEEQVRIRQKGRLPLDIIYKYVIRSSINVYVADMRSETAKTQQQIEACEMECSEEYSIKPEEIRTE